MATTRQRAGLFGTAGLATVTLLVTLAVWTSAAGGRWAPIVGRSAEELPVEIAPTPSPSPTPELIDGSTPVQGAVLSILIALTIVTLIVGLGAGLRAVRTPWQSREPKEKEVDGEDGGFTTAVSDLTPDIVELREGIAEAWARLVEDRDPTDAIQAAWVAVEQAAERSGIPREPSDTPTEFTVAVLDRTAVDPSAIRTLLGLYHRARFSTHGASADDVTLAGQCLSRLDEGLAP